MLDFIMVPLIVGIVTLGIYKLFELFARRKERLAMIEKLGDKLDASKIENGISLTGNISKNSPFGTLKVACLLLGVGLGLLVGFFIVQLNFGGYESLIERSRDTYNAISDTTPIIYGASVLLFGGLGLLVAFITEIKYLKKKEK